MTSDVRTAPAATPLEEFVTRDAYLEWQEHEGVKVIRDFAFQDLRTIELAPWERKGGEGAIINIPNDHLANDAHVVEIKPGGKSEPEHHMYEELVYVLSGRGATSLWTEGGRPGSGPKEVFEWHTGSLFAIPLNTWYQHFNASGNEPVRYIAITTAPPMMRLFNNRDFIFNCDYTFTDRYSGRGGYFSGNGKLHRQQALRHIWEANFIASAPAMGFGGRKERGAGGSDVLLEMAGNTTKALISEFPVGTYRKAHRHGPGAHLILLGQATGFSSLWRENEEPRRVDWQENAMIVVPSDDCFHQDFNTGTASLRYLTVQPGNQGLMAPVAAMQADPDAPPDKRNVRRRQIEYVEYKQEDPKVHDLFEAELAKHGARCRMKAFVPWCTGEIGPANEWDT